jgi:hypothetical protein
MRYSIYAHIFQQGQKALLVFSNQSFKAVSFFYPKNIFLCLGYQEIYKTVYIFTFRAPVFSKQKINFPKLNMNLGFDILNHSISQSFHTLPHYSETTP